MPTADQMKPRNERERAVLGFFQTIMKRDLAAFADLWTDDAHQYFPFAEGIEGLAPTRDGKQTIVNYYTKSISNRRDHVFTIHAMHETTDPECYIVEAHGRSLITETNRIYDQSYVVVFHLRDGKIAKMREYFNPMVFAKAFDGFMSGKGMPVQ